jgi:hypothetical protein
MMVTSILLVNQSCLTYFDLLIWNITSCISLTQAMLVLQFKRLAIEPLTWRNQVCLQRVILESLCPGRPHRLPALVVGALTCQQMAIS